jgi:hypothetical protein
MEGDTHLQGIFTYLLIFMFISTALIKEPQNQGPYGNMPIAEL